MTPTSIPRPLVLLVYALLATIALAGRAEAQFETANRQFHNQTTFPLDGRHRDLPCESCHRQGVYKGTPTRCFDCHWTRRQDDRYRLQLGSQCETCHRASSWTAVQWDHAAMTGTTLGAAHRQLSCQSCHRNNTFRAAQTTCISCHQQDFQSARTPNHVAAGFPTTCEACHRVNDTDFHQARFDHAASFPLLGVHAQQTCASCHKNNVYLGTPRDCVGCHRTDYDRTTSPNHLAAGFPTACETCHRPTDASFRGASFNHSAVYALVGVHAQQTCATCHVNNIYKGTSRDCVGCHRTAYDRTTMPSHVAAGFSTNCDTCHRPSDPDWRGSFSHSSFSLVGVHAQQTCAACHGNGVYRGTPTTCAGCHITLYNRTTNPNHVAAGFPTTCDSCHRATDTSWLQGTFNHRFPITSGPHNTACINCHTGGSFQTFNCLNCHQRSETDSHHRSIAGYRYDSLACYSCHPNGRH